MRVFTRSSSVLMLVFGAAVFAAAPGIARALQEREEQNTRTVAGIRVTVKADAWSGDPVELTEVIPLLVTVENNSNIPIRLRYPEFTLVGNGEKSAALPPFEIKGTETEPVGTFGAPLGPYPYPLRGFYVAPYLGRFYPHLTPFGGVFAFDPLFFSMYYPVWRRINLPTGDMIQKALPEGVLEPGGRVAGFLYFEDIDVEAKNDIATFTFDVVNAKSERRVATIRMPIEID